MTKLGVRKCIRRCPKSSKLGVRKCIRAFAKRPYKIIESNWLSVQSTLPKFHTLAKCSDALIARAARTFGKV